VNVVSDDMVLPGFEFFSGLQPSGVPAMTGSTAEYDDVRTAFVNTVILYVFFPLIA
jgi:hypothetical protein